MQPDRNDRYHSLDVWRGISCLMVLVFHACVNQYKSIETLAPIPKAIFSTIGAGWLGVPIFFVISGYCISSSCQARRGHRHPFSGFLLRRYRRIFPPVWILMAITAALASFGPHDSFFRNIIDPAGLTAWQWAGNITLTESFRHHFAGGPEKYIMSHLWSLSYEEQFYAVCAIGLLAAPYHFFRFCGIVTLTVAVIVAAVYTTTGGLDSVRGFFFDGQWVLFACGVLVYWLLNHATQARAKIASSLLALVAASLAAGLLTGLLPSKAFAWQTTVAAAFSAALLLLRDSDRQITGKLTWLARCGKMSYSLYLVHYPVTLVIGSAELKMGIGKWWQTLAITLPLDLVVSLLAAAWFHRLVERRFSMPQEHMAAGALRF